MSSKTVRSYPIDIAKVILIYFVLLGHVMTINCTGGILIYAFHMPAFFILSGFLINNELTLFKLIKKLFNNLIKPYFYFVVIGILFILIRNCFTLKDVFDNNFWWQLFYDMAPDKIFMGAGWFLWAMFWGRIFYFLIEAYCNIYIKNILYMLLCILSFNLFFIWNTTLGVDYPPLRIDSGCLATVFIKIGSLIKKNETCLFYNNNTKKILIILIVSLVFVASSIANGLTAMRPRMFNNILLYMVASVSGTLVIILISFL